MNREIPESQKGLYYISTGEHMVYYTLWKRPRAYTAGYVKDAYICNLSIDYDEAIAKVKTKLGFIPEIVREPINKPKERAHIQGDIIRFGKYAGLPIWLAYKYDPDYIGWVNENCDSQNALPNINYIKENYEGFIEEYKEAAQREIQEREQRQVDRKRQIIAEKEASQFVGTIGKREEFTVKINKVIPLDNGYWGRRWLHIMKDPNGNELIWNCTNGKTQLEKEKTYRIKATVKDHQVYDSKIYGEVVYVNQTALNRVVRIEGE